MQPLLASIVARSLASGIKTASLASPGVAALRILLQSTAALHTKQIKPAYDLEAVLEEEPRTAPSQDLAAEVPGNRA